MQLIENRREHILIVEDEGLIAAVAYSTSTILLVDDDESVRRLMHKFLEREGYQEQRGLSMDDVNLLPKPFRAAELLRRVELPLAQGTQVVQ